MTRDNKYKRTEWNKPQLLAPRIHSTTQHFPANFGYFVTFFHCLGLFFCPLFLDKALLECSPRLYLQGHVILEAVSGTRLYREALSLEGPMQRKVMFPSPGYSDGVNTTVCACNKAFPIPAAAPWWASLGKFHETKRDQRNMPALGKSKRSRGLFPTIKGRLPSIVASAGRQVNMDN